MKTAITASFSGLLHPSISSNSFQIVGSYEHDYCSDGVVCKLLDSEVFASSSISKLVCTSPTNIYESSDVSLLKKQFIAELQNLFSHLQSKFDPSNLSFEQAERVKPEITNNLVAEDYKQHVAKSLTLLEKVKNVYDLLCPNLNRVGKATETVSSLMHNSRRFSNFSIIVLRLIEQIIDRNTAGEENDGKLLTRLYFNRDCLRQQYEHMLMRYTKLRYLPEFAFEASTTADDLSFCPLKYDAYLTKEFTVGLQNLFSHLKTKYSAVKPPKTIEPEVNDIRSVREYSRHVAESLPLLHKVLVIYKQLSPGLQKTDDYTEATIACLIGALRLFSAHSEDALALIESNVNLNFKPNNEGELEFQRKSGKVLDELFSTRRCLFVNYGHMLEYYENLSYLPQLAPLTSTAAAAAAEPHLNIISQEESTAAAAAADHSHCPPTKYDDYLKKKLTVELQLLCSRVQSEFLSAQPLVDPCSQKLNVAVLHKYRDCIMATLPLLRRVGNIRCQLAPYLRESPDALIEGLLHDFDQFSFFTSAAIKLIEEYFSSPNDEKTNTQNLKDTLHNRFEYYCCMSKCYKSFKAFKAEHLSTAAAALHLDGSSRQKSSAAAAATDVHFLCPLSFDKSKKQLAVELQKLLHHLTAQHEPIKNSARPAAAAADWVNRTPDIAEILWLKRHAETSLPKLEKVRTTISQLFMFKETENEFIEQALISLFLCLGCFSVNSSNFLNFYHEYRSVAKNPAALRKKFLNGQKEREDLLNTLRRVCSILKWSPLSLQLSTAAAASAAAASAASKRLSLPRRPPSPNNNLKAKSLSSPSSLVSV